ETAKNFEDMTLRRKLTVTTPNTTYDADEWDQYDLGVYDGIGIYDPNTASVSTLNFETIKMYPNPVNGNKIFFNLTKDVNVNIYNVLGKLITAEKINKKNNSIDVSNFSKGVYLLKINSGKRFITKKLIKN
ncbi:MAG: T9SS type A sorting domain-containing protein, partial [Polaribacter sp.]|nr:T9SS type A sorting domain-containing protein [Polaribacter sp.]